MTCIVAIKGEKEIVLGGDSAGVSGFDVIVRRDPKVFIQGKFAIGFAGSFRMGQLLMNLTVKPQTRNQKDYEYMVTTFIDAVRKLFKKGGFLKKENDQEEGGSFIVAYRGEIYHIDSDFQVGIATEPYVSVGCGESYALGACAVMLRGTETEDGSFLAPSAACEEALKIAEKFSGGVRGPFNYVSVKR